MFDKLCLVFLVFLLLLDGVLLCYYNNLCLLVRIEYIIYWKQIFNGSNGDGILIIVFDYVKIQMVEIWIYVINKGNYVCILFFGVFFYYSIVKINWQIEFYEFRVLINNYFCLFFFVFWQLVDDVLVIIMFDKYFVFLKIMQFVNVKCDV